MKRIMLFWLAGCLALTAETRHIKLYVGLCDNKTQGIAKVGEKIGDGDKPGDNLYWGCSDGVSRYFTRKNSAWKLEKKETETGDDRILERLTFRHKQKDAVMIAEAWRGSKLSEAMVAFEREGVSSKTDLIAFIGHNALMDGEIKPPSQKATEPVDAIILCCMSESYFGDRLRSLEINPVLTTSQLMYPGSFILHDSLEVWLDSGSKTKMREAAGKAYAKNQKISVSAAKGVFHKPEG